MDKLSKLINLEFLKGSRTKISLIGFAVLRLLAWFGFVSKALVDGILWIGLPVAIYFALEHFEKK